MSKLVHVSFHGDTLDCIRHDDGEAYVVVKRVCENLGISYPAQLKKVQGASWAFVAMIATKSSSDGRHCEMACLRIDSVPIWLAGINLKKVRDEFLRTKLDLYQSQCAKVLWDHFSGGGSLAQITDRLDRICLVLEERQDTALTQMRQDMDERFKAQERALEGRLQEQLPLAFHNPPASSAFIDDSQKDEVRSFLITSSKRQHLSFQKVHGRLRVYLKVSGYRQIRNEQYPKALAFLQAEAAKVPKTPEQLNFDTAMSLN